jgi:hypothetical protein
MALGLTLFDEAAKAFQYVGGVFGLRLDDL